MMVAPFHLGMPRISGSYNLWGEGCGSWFMARHQEGDQMWADIHLHAQVKNLELTPQSSCNWSFTPLISLEKQRLASIKTPS